MTVSGATGAQWIAASPIVKLGFARILSATLTSGTRGSGMGKRVADVLVETLQAADVKTCYGIVGDTLNRIAHAMDRSEIDWVHVRHEEAGALAAAAEALFTGRLTACAGTCGPGSLHFINGLYEANRNARPSS
jgi:glyoxylate carboligase